MAALFLDSSYLIALDASDDQYHSLALAHWQKLSENLPPIITTSYIFAEVVTHFNNRQRHTKAVEVGGSLLDSELIRLVHVNESLFLKGWSVFRKYKDKNYSLTDCISFSLMLELGISEALTFDKHFTQAGFTARPKK
jgi:predicted nucleic acid-binding protein